MVGIISYGAYISLWRLGKETKGWEKSTERAIAGFDEDAVTMAVAAGINCLKGLERYSIDELYFASTSSPYKEKQAAATVATAIDLRPNIFSTDFANSLRAGTMALKAAIDTVKANPEKKVLIIATDVRIPQPRSELDEMVGDGAAAILIGSSGVAVEIEDGYFISDEILDVWRPEGGKFIHSWEDRFTFEAGYFNVLPKAASEIMNKHSLNAKDFAKAVLYGPNPRRQMEAARRLGFDVKTQVQDPMFTTLGNTGAAFALMMLIAALEEAKEGDRILLANYGNGADAFILRATKNIEKIENKRGVKGHLQSKKILKDYQTYANWRGLIDLAPPARRPPLEPPSASSVWRERDQIFRFYGVKCKKCGYSQYPIQRICAKCHSKDNFELERFAEKKGELFTYSMDYLAPTLDPPLVVSIVNFEGGGRAMLEMTDRDINEIRVGMPLEMSFRKLYQAGDIHHYYWKCIPSRFE
jgi:3-hydroxy-3-methylglutaryl CoA synthase